MATNPYNIDFISLDAAGSKVLPSFKGALHFRMAYTGGARDQFDRVSGETDDPTARIWFELGENGPVPIYPGESIRTLDTDGGDLEISWTAQPGVTAVVLMADPARLEADLRKRAL